MTFVVEHHNGKTYHVYGDGKDRQMIEVRTKPSTGGASTGSTGK
jgi:hypothetical protein